MNKGNAKLSTRAWIAMLAAFVVVCVWFALRTRPASPELVAGIYVDGVCVRRVDLNQVKEAERYEIEGYGGKNVILIEKGRICMESADCPDGICVAEGWLPDFGFPIVCLPHHLYIQMEDGGP